MLNKYLKITFFLFLAIIAGHHILLFYTVNRCAIDNDQVVMWLGAKHYSQGLFYEPRFYGQAYNTMLESLVAVPFVWLKTPVYFAVPLATHILFLFPFLFPACYLYHKNQTSKAILILAVLICMPLGYDILTSIPRGFVTGLFFTSFFIINLRNPKNYTFIIINTAFAYLGYLVNQNSVVVSAPFLFYLFLMNYSHKKYVIYSAIGLLLAAPFYFLLNHYYNVHPQAVLYGHKIEFSYELFKQAISHLDDRFAHVGLFIEESCVITLCLFVLIGVYFFYKNKPWFYSFLVFISILIFSFFVDKTADAVVWPFYSYSRMYLGIPVFFILSITFISSDLKKAAIIIAAATLVFMTVKMANFKSTFKYHIDPEKWSHLNLISLEQVFSTLDIYRNVCKTTFTNDLVMIDSVWLDDFINYGGPALYSDYPNTFKPSFERRRWRIEQEMQHKPERFIVYTANKDFDKLVAQQYKDITITRVNDWGCFLITKNKRSVVEFVKYVGGATDGF